MKRHIHLTILLGAMILGAGCPGFAAQPPQPIQVSPNGRYFVKADGTPFFWLGDTAWSIFNHPKPEDVDLYLNDRAAKGFTVIQGVLALWDYRNRANPDGQLPFVNGDLGQVNEAFYKNVDSILDKVESRGMYMAILPFWHKNSATMLGTGDNPEKMKAYCKFLAQRYAKRNVFWILGGDASAMGAQGTTIQHVTDLEAEGLMEGAKAAGVDKILISYHPTGRQSSSFWYQERPWLSFNSIQSGHFIRTTNFRLVGDDYAKTPVKPTLDMEPGYENITDGLMTNTPTAVRISANDVRRSAYLAVFAGAAGHTYGCGEVYEFWSSARGGIVARWGSGLDWHESLKLPASGQVQYLRYLIESRPMLIRAPDQSLIVGAVSTLATERLEAMRGSDGSYAFVFTPTGKPFTVDVTKLSGQTLRCWWYDTRTGRATLLGEMPREGSREFTPPSGGAGNDWVLVLDDSSKGFAPPGRQQ
ncbi:MAG: glycoside hydrolase family 140 protein [Verrucomicrobiota bacterium]